MILHVIQMFYAGLPADFCRRCFIRAGILLLGCAVMGLAAAPVTVSGSGATREAALQEAFREAVRQGIGTYIESSTMIRNDAIIRENLIEFAYGYVDNYKVLSESKQRETYTVKIEADVSNQDVSAALANILPADTLTEKDREKLNIQIGNEITAQINQHLRAKRKAAIDKAAGKICRKIFEEYKEAFLLVYEFIPNKIQVTGATETEVTFSVSGTLRTNPELYNLLLNSMIARFERVLRKKISTRGGRFKFLAGSDFQENSFDLSVEDHTVNDLYSVFALPYKSNGLELKYLQLVIGDVDVYHLNDIPFLKKIPYSRERKLKKISAALLVYLVDKKGNIIWGDDRNFEIRPLRYDMMAGMSKIIITPYFQLHHDHSKYNPYPLDKGVTTYRRDWPSPCLERILTTSYRVPIKIARNVAGVKGVLLNDNPKGEALLDQLLKGTRQ